MSVFPSGSHVWDIVQKIYAAGSITFLSQCSVWPANFPEQNTFHRPNNSILGFLSKFWSPMWSGILQPIVKTGRLKKQTFANRCTSTLFAEVAMAKRILLVLQRFFFGGDDKTEICCGKSIGRTRQRSHVQAEDPP